MALNNELADLRLVVLAIQDIYQKHHLGDQLHGPQDVDIDSSVTSALSQAQETVAEMQTLYDQLSISSSGQTGLANLRKKIWLLEPRKARRVQEDLQNVRLKLATVLGILNS